MLLCRMEYMPCRDYITMTPDELQAFSQRLSELIVPWIAERTGYSGDMIRAVFDAQNEFWEAQVQKHGAIPMQMWFMSDDG